MESIGLILEAGNDEKCSENKETKSLFVYMVPTSTRS